MRNLHEIRTVRCAQCGKLRQDANHWFVVAVEQGRFYCMPLGTASWSSHCSLHLEHRLKVDQQPACGQHCAQKLFERYLAAEAMLNITNRMMGFGPTIQILLEAVYNNNQFNVLLYNAMASKLNFATKQEDFIVPELDFEAFANAAGQVIDIYSGE